MKGIKISSSKIVLISTLVGVIATAVSIILFSAVMYFAGLDKIYSVIFATISVAIGCFFASFTAALKNKSKGFLTGLVVGGITFAIIFLISLMYDKGAVGTNTLFHFIIFMHSSVVGGVLGVNKVENRKYIKWFSRHNLL